MTYRRVPWFLLVTLSACFVMPPVAPTYTPVDPAQQRAAYAQSLGYPTRKTPQELEQTIAAQTEGFELTGRPSELRLEAPAPFVFEGVSGTCYTVVMRLAPGAAWGPGAEAGLRFDFRRPEIAGSGGPGVVGPGAVASVGCAEASGPITLTMAPTIGTDPIGQGALQLELYRRVLTRAERRRLAEDRERQIAEQRVFAAQQAEREARAREEREAAFAAGRAEERSSARASSAASGPTSVSVTIRSSCARTVKVFYGDTPRFGSGTTSSVSSNSVSSRRFRVGDMMWVLDDRGEGASTVSQSTRTIEITASCTGLTSR